MVITLVLVVLVVVDVLKNSRRERERSYFLPFLCVVSGLSFLLLEVVFINCKVDI